MDEDDDRPAARDDGSFADEARRLGGRFWDYLTTRTIEHWLMFAVGVIVGLLLS